MNYGVVHALNSADLWARDTLALPMHVRADGGELHRPSRRNDLIRAVGPESSLDPAP